MENIQILELFESKLVFKQILLLDNLIILFLIIFQQEI